MKILINISAISKQSRGMGSFTKAILLELLSTKGLEFILVSCIDIDLELHDEIIQKDVVFKKINLPLPIFEQLIIPFFIKKYMVDCCWFPSNTFPLYKVNNVRYIVTIHDIIYLDKFYFPKSVYQKIGKFYRSFNVRHGIKKIDVVTSVSMTALKDIYSYFNIERKVDNRLVLYNSTKTPVNFDNSIIETLKLKKRKYIYTISGTAPHKNLPFLVDCFIKSGVSKEFKLVITGVPANHHDQYIDHDVLLTNFITEGEKNALIKNASLFVFASLKEGFGIPLIEAIHLNRNILVSDIEVFKEIGGPYVNYSSPLNGNFFDIFFKKDSIVIVNNIKESSDYINKVFSVKSSTGKLLEIIKNHHE